MVNEIRVKGVKGVWQRVRLLMWESVPGFLKEVMADPRLDR